MQTSPNPKPWSELTKGERRQRIHAVGVEYASKGWTWQGKKYECRKDWEASVLGYHGQFKI